MSLATSRYSVTPRRFFRPGEAVAALLFHSSPPSRGLPLRAHASSLSIRFPLRDERGHFPATKCSSEFPSAETRFLQIRARFVAILARVSCYSRSSLAISQLAFSAVVTDFCFVRFLSVLVRILFIIFQDVSRQTRVIGDIVKVTTTNCALLQYDEHNE